MKILIGCPTRGMMFHACMSFLIHQREKGHTIYKHTSALSVEAARMGIARYFLDKDFTHLFFMDDDVVCPDYCIEQLLEHDKDIVSLNYPIYQDGILHSCAYDRMKDENEYHPWPFNTKELRVVMGIGLGGALIKREVIEKVIGKEPFKMSFNSSGDIETGDDIKFCQEVIREGFIIWCDFDLTADHYKLVSLTAMHDMIGR